MKWKERVYKYIESRVIVFEERRKQSALKNLKQEIVHNGILLEGYTINLPSLPIITKYPGSTFSIGNNCVLLGSSSENPAGISHPCVLATLTNTATLIIGDNVGISGASICCVNSIHIGDYVNLGVGVRIYDTDFHPLDYFERRKNPGFNLDKIPHAPIKIGNDVWIGAASIILKGVVLGDRVIVAAGSVVTKSFPADCIIGGNPARVIRGEVNNI